MSSTRDTSLRRLWRHARSHRGTVWKASAYSILEKIFDLAPPVLIGAAVDIVSRQENSLMGRFGIADVPTQLLVLTCMTLVIWSFE